MVALFFLCYTSKFGNSTYNDQPVSDISGNSVMTMVQWVATFLETTKSWIAHTDAQLNSTETNMTMYDDVVKFHQKVLKVPPLDRPKLLKPDDMIARFNFMSEELNEFYMHGYVNQDLVETTDALIDLVYVALGTLYLMGIPANTAWSYVHAANMKKELGVTKRGSRLDTFKPEHWVSPNVRIAALLESLQD